VSLPSVASVRGRQSASSPATSWNPTPRGSWGGVRTLPPFRATILSVHKTPDAPLPCYPPSWPPDRVGRLPQRWQQVQCHHRPRGSSLLHLGSTIRWGTRRRPPLPHQRVAQSAGVTALAPFVVIRRGSAPPPCGAPRARL
jgi:hypothetical protein